MPNEAFDDLEKQELLEILFLNRICAPGLGQMAAKIARSVSDEKQRQSAIILTSHYLAMCGDSDGAAALVDDHLDGTLKATALALIGSELAKSNSAPATQYLEEAQRLLEGTDDPDGRVTVLQRLAAQYLELNQNTRAWELARMIAPPSERSYTLCQIAKRLWDGGEIDSAIRVLADARASAEETASPDRANTWDDLARLLLHMGRTEEAVDAWDEATKFADESHDPSKLLLLISKSLLSLGRKEKANEIALAIRNDARRAQALALINSSV